MMNGVLGRNRSRDHLVQLTRVLSDPTRLRLLGLLETSSQNVKALCEQLDLPQPTVSHHLGLLREAELVISERNGKIVIYSLNEHRVRPLDTPGGGISIDFGDVQMRLTSVDYHTAASVEQVKQAV